MSKTIKILLVEDEIVLCQSLKTIIESLGVTVIDTITGQQALDALGQEHIDIVICDINLPDLSGYDILRQVKSIPEYVATPFILLTAFADEKDVAEGYTLGATAYITKPFSSRELMKMLSELIDEIGKV